jgi:hypothetical protein
MSAGTYGGAIIGFPLSGYVAYYLGQDYAYYIFGMVLIILYKFKIKIFSTPIRYFWSHLVFNIFYFCIREAFNASDDYSRRIKIY